jgi:hypothetical protein
MIFVVGVLVAATIRGAGEKRNPLGTYSRILVNHVQMLVIIYAFRLDWPGGFSDVFGSAEPAAEAPQQFVSLD